MNTLDALIKILDGRILQTELLGKCGHPLHDKVNVMSSCDIHNPTGIPYVYPDTQCPIINWVNNTKSSDVLMYYGDYIPQMDNFNNRIFLVDWPTRRLMLNESVVSIKIDNICIENMIGAILLCICSIVMLTFICYKLRTFTCEPIEIYTKSDSETCTICIEDIHAGNRIKTLECKHVFHKNCINKWLKTKSTCPNCNADVYERLL